MRLTQIEITIGKQFEARLKEAESKVDYLRILINKSDELAGNSEAKIVD